MLAPKKSARQEKVCAKSGGGTRLHSGFDDAGRENSAYRVAR